MWSRIESGYEAAGLLRVCADARVMEVIGSAQGRGWSGKECGGDRNGEGWCAVAGRVWVRSVGARRRRGVASAAEGDALMAETDARWRRRDADGKWEVP